MYFNIWMKKEVKNKRNRASDFSEAPFLCWRNNRDEHSASMFADTEVGLFKISVVTQIDDQATWCIFADACTCSAQRIEPIFFLLRIHFVQFNELL